MLSVFGNVRVVYRYYSHHVYIFFFMLFFLLFLAILDGLACFLVFSYPVRLYISLALP